ncbi:MAG: CdaR family protein [Acidobacteria bacterium]|nr:CdaR family protein [Acidobacteriota bacterium]
MPFLDEHQRAEAVEIARDAWHRARGAVRQTPGLFVVSLIFGISFWVFVTDTENPTVVDFFPQPIAVEAVNVGDSLAVANPLPAINVRISAPTDRWDELTAANLRASVDLRGFDARSQDVPVFVEVQGIGGVRVVDSEPRFVTVNLEALVSRDVPVRARTVGSLPTGYELGAMAPTVTTVRVTGPESLVALVAEGAADVQVTGLTVGLEQAVLLKPLGAGGAEIRGVRLEPESVRVAVEINQSTLVRTLPLTVEIVGNPDPGFRVTSVLTSPAAIQVQGPIELLQQFDAIALPSVNVNGARTDIVRSVAIPLPQGLAYVDRERATITVSVAPLTGRVRLSLPIEPEGLAPNSSASISPGNVEVVVEGPMPVLNALATADVRAVINLLGRVGTLSGPVDVTAPEGVTVISVQPPSVAVTITP